MISGCIEGSVRRYVGARVKEKLKEEGIETTENIKDKINVVLDSYNWNVNLLGGIKLYAQSHDENEIYNKVKQKLGV